MNANHRPLIVAGGGLAGAAAACLLARAGRPVCIIERERSAKHKVCGEFLSHEAQHYLSELGVDLVKLGAVPINRVRLLHKSQAHTADLPFRGMSLSRHVLDEALLRQAAHFGAEVLRGHAIRAVELDDRLRLVVDGFGDITTQTLFLASGKHELRGVGRKIEGDGHDLVGLKTYINLLPAQQQLLERHVDISLFQDGYAGLQMIENKMANLCLLVKRRRFSAADNDWTTLLSHLCAENTQLRARLDGARDLLPRPLAIYRLPYGFLHHPNAGDAPNLFRLGDQMAVTPSFSGVGMSIALHTAFAAAQAYLVGEDAYSFHLRMRQDIGRQLRWTRLLSAGALTRIGQEVLVHAVNFMPSLLSTAARKTRLQPAPGAWLQGDVSEMAQ